MARLGDLLPRQQYLALAVHVQSPARLAETMARYSGQFYDRAAFDGIAREIHALYQVRDPDRATEFRQRLDTHLERGARATVVWAAAKSEQAQS